ncbi:VCBS repeat-containing protein [Amycolatopsis sp., V23-08]|uniref:VCBS repeat-containing protein n=1 Tax=Amycolatopsis heterodermiae TaxID=3110235 RepID=A0ABU5RAE3_9PSEU|nr:VCBS repeat-containing protein [Amycolatopsis sp., V23-08]MEA5363208.1 VCBS repeat-containing protein [Amycolatopsis sp., V23-08]
MNRTGLVRTAAVAGLAAALGLTAAAPALAAEPITTVADLNGDGQPETVTAQLTGEGDQLISATVNGTYTSIHLPADSQFGIQAPRVTDLNGDGWAELIVAQSIGANTTFYSVLHYDGRNLSQVVGADDKPFTVAEGGGIAAHLGYQCTPFEGGRAFATVAAETDDISRPVDQLTYSGKRTVYTLRDGALSIQDTTPFSGRKLTDPVLTEDPASCA